MGSCQSSNYVDIQCNHNKPHLAICLGGNCSRGDGDRRLCEECLVDHMCIDRVTIEDAIVKDVYDLKMVFEKYEKDQNSPAIYGGLQHTIINFKNHFMDCFKSYEAYYEIYLNQFLQSGVPESEIFPEAAVQIFEAFQKNDLGYIRSQGCQILITTFNNPNLVKQIISNLDQASKKMAIYQTQVEIKLKKLQDQLIKELQLVPITIAKQDSFNNSILDIDPQTYIYEFPTYITTTETTRGGFIELNCSEHNQKIQVICCDRCTNKDVRLCGQCLITHKCNVALRIKLKSFSQDQSAIIDASQRFLKKKNEIQELKMKIKSIFEEIIKNIINQIDQLGQNSKKIMLECQLSNIDFQIRLELPSYIMVFANRSMVSLDAKGVAIIVYLIQNQHLKQEILTYDAKVTSKEFQQKLIHELEELGRRFLLPLSQVEDIGTLEKKPSQNLEVTSYVTTNNLIQNQNMNKTINGNTMHMSLPKQNVQSIQLQINKDFEQKVDGCPILRVLKDFGDDQDNYVSDICYNQNHLIISTIEGLITIYEGIGESKIESFELPGKCISICSFIYKEQLAIAACIGSYEEHKIGILTFNGSFKHQGYLIGHTDPILKIKQLIKQEYLVSCSGDHSIRIWDTSSQQILEQIKPKVLLNHQLTVRDVIVINNIHLVSGSFDETIQIYDLKSDKIIYAVQVEDWIYCLQNISDKAFAVGTGHGDIRLFSCANFNEITRVHIAPNYINSIVPFNNPNYLFLSCKNRDNYIIRLQEYQQIDYITKNEEEDMAPEGILIIDNYLIYGDCNIVKIKNAN